MLAAVGCIRFWEVGLTGGEEGGDCFGENGGDLVLCGDSSLILV